MLPKTASEAVQAWDRRELIDTFRIEARPAETGISVGAKSYPLADQGAAYMLVFQILRHAIAAGAVGEKTTYRQFDSWCFQQHLAVAQASTIAPGGRPPEEVAAMDAIKGFCYGVLREGWGNVVARHIDAPRIQVRKP